MKKKQSRPTQTEQNQIKIKSNPQNEMKPNHKMGKRIKGERETGMGKRK
jgi:hypothetical protein